MLSRIFWFLLLLFSTTLIPLALFLPETCRQVVGDGSIPPPWICSNVTDSLRSKNRQSKGLPINYERESISSRGSIRGVPNPMASLKIVMDPESAILLVTLSLGK